MFRTVKTTATRPRPSATVETIVKATSGARLKVRNAYSTSRTVLSTKAVPRSSRHSSAASGTGPNRFSAAARASAGLMPAGRRASAFRVRCGTRARHRARARRDSARTVRGRAVSSRASSSTSGELHDAADRVRHPLPLARFDGELAAAGRGQRVVLGAAAQL